MGYEKQDHLIEEALQDLRSSPADWPVNIPWAPGRIWSINARPAATVGLTLGCLGITKNEKGDFRFYVGSRNAGNPFFRIWSPGVSVLLAAPLLYLMLTGFMAGKTNGIANLLGMISGAAMILLFAGKAKGLFMATGIYHAMGRNYQGIVWGGVMAALLGGGAVFGGMLRMLSGLEYSMDFDWPSLFLDSPGRIAKHRGLLFLSGWVTNALGFIGILLVMRFGPLLMEASGIGVMNQFSINEACAPARVPADVYYAAGRDRFTGQGTWLGMLLTVVLFAASFFSWIAYA